MLTLETITTAATDGGEVCSDYFALTDNFYDGYEGYWLGFSGKIPEIETYNGEDCLYSFKGHELMSGDKAQQVLISLPLKVVELEANCEKYSEEELKELALDLVKQPFIFEDWTEYSDDYEGYTLLLQSICYALDGYPLKDGVVIKRCCWNYEKLEVLKVL